MVFFLIMNQKRRGETFVTRKITRCLSRIAMGLEDCLYIGNLDSKRDWGHAKDYVEMQWLMLQQDKPKDYVIATGIQYSVREFIEFCIDKLDLKITWEGNGVNEVARLSKINSKFNDRINVGDIIIKVDARYFRPTEVDTLLGDPSKAKKELKWSPKISINQLVDEMMENDLKEAERQKNFRKSIECELWISIMVKSLLLAIKEWLAQQFCVNLKDLI